MNLEGWKDFFTAAAGAASALAGLVFVALSINLTRILETPGLPARGAETIILLSAALIAALVSLIPAESAQTLGLVLGAVGLFAWGVPVGFQVRAARGGYYQLHWQLMQRVALHQLATVPMLLASVFVFCGVDYALNWLAAGVILSLVVGLLNAWVLLVEIVRWRKLSPRPQLYLRAVLNPALRASRPAAPRSA
jgi:modulator of FtsH protease